MEGLLQSVLTSKDTKDYNISHLILNANEWNYLKILCNIFSFYYLATIKMLAQAYPTIYHMLLQYIILKSSLENCKTRGLGAV
jgi:hypothetical protein